MVSSSRQNCKHQVFLKCRNTMGVFVNNFKFYLDVMQSADEEEEEEQEEQSKLRRKLPLKLLLCYTFLIQGLYRYVPGPILHDIGKDTGNKITPIVFTIRAIGYIVGVIIGSFIHHYLLHSNQKKLLIFLWTFLMSVTAFGTAMSETFIAIKVSFAAAGFCLGAVITGVNALYLHTSMIPTKTFCLTLYFFFGIGALIAPLITRQYFIHQEDIDRRNASMYENATEYDGKMTLSEKNVRDAVAEFFESFPIPFTTLSYAYVATCGMIFIESLLWLSLYCVTAGTPENIPEEPDMDEKGDILALKNLGILIASLTCFISESIDFSYAEILPIIFSVGYNASPRETTEIMALFLGCLCVSRIMALFFSWKIKSYNMRILGIIFVLAGCIIWYVYESWGVVYFWIANGFIGFGAGPLFGSAHNWISDKYCVHHMYIMPFFLMSSFSEMFMPWAFCLTANHDYPKVKLILVIISVLYVVLIASQHLIVYEMNKRRKKKEELEKEARPIEEILPSLLRRRFPDSSTDITDEEESSTQEEQEPEGNPHKVFSRLSELKERLDQDNKEVIRSLNLLHYSVVTKGSGVQHQKKEK